MRFVRDNTVDGTWYVWDNGLRQRVPNTYGKTPVQCSQIQDVLNQRVERPELTKADGKLVSA